jgi:cytochrome c-type biogenesis protein CcmH
MNQFLVAALFLVNVPSLTTGQRAQIRKIEERLLAPCCYSQPVAQHMSDAAQEMRDEITRMVEEGRGETEIINNYKSQYGDRILLVPDGTNGRVLFCLPILAFLLCSGALGLFLWKILRSGGDQPATQAKQQFAQVSKMLRGRIESEMGDPL